jgi:hypothetical protein
MGFVSKRSRQPQLAATTGYALREACQLWHAAADYGGGDGPEAVSQQVLCIGHGWSRAKDVERYALKSKEHARASSFPHAQQCREGHRGRVLQDTVLSQLAA